MSYVEHGPRIFLAARPSHGSPTIYGDYVLPRKRSEGRLKVYESCSDIRAWSPNPLESSRYFRELAEHAPTPGKIVPFNVVIDNVIGLGSQAQNELATCRRELQKYKNLKLTPEQEYQLRTNDGVQIDRINEPGTSANSKNVGRKRSLSKPVATGTGKPQYDTPVRSYSVSPERSPKSPTASTSFHTDDDVELNTYEFAEDESINSRSTSPGRIHGTERGPSYIQSTGKSLRSNPSARSQASRRAAPTSDVKSSTSKSTSATTRATTPQSSTDGYSDEEFGSGHEDMASQILRPTGKTVEFESSSESHGGTGTGTDTGTGTTSGTDYDTDDGTHKTTIIQKDSEIIALKNELGAREVELEELRDLNKNLEVSLKEKDDDLRTLKANFKISQEQLAGMGDQRNYEAEKLKKKISTCECLISELKGELAEKAATCYAQSQDVEDLRFRVKEAELLRVERDALAKKVEEMGRLSKEAENCALALEQMKVGMRERDELRRQNREQGCALADQEDEIKRLLNVIDHLSTKYDNRQVRMKGALEDMRAEIEEKNSKICQCEQHLAFMEQEVGNLTVKLKNSLNSMDEFKIVYEDACNCADLDQDIYSQAKNALCKLNLTMGELKEYKIERESLLRQIEDLKSRVQSNNKCRACCQQQGGPGPGPGPGPGSGPGSGLGPGPGFGSGPGPGGGTGNSAAYDNRNSYFTQNCGEWTVLDMRKRRLALREELEELENELYKRTGSAAGTWVEESTVGDEEDMVASAKQTINRLNNAMLNLDAWECEKASMVDTIERLNIQITTLKESNGDGGGIEQRIVELASCALTKMRHLLKELRTYSDERQGMFIEIANLKEALSDAQAAASCQGGVLLKDRLCTIRVEHEKERNELLEEITCLQKQLDEAENSSSCAKVRALRLKLREALRNASYDEDVDQVLATHVKKSIDRINKISAGLRGAGDERTDIVKEVLKQQEEINQKTMQIAEQQGEGDRVNQDRDNQKRLFEEAKKKLELKNALIREIEEKLQSREFQFFGLNEEHKALKTQLENLECQKNEISTDNEERKNDLRAKEEKVIQLISENNILLKANLELTQLEKKVEEMEPRLAALQTENEQLMSELITIRGLLSENNDNLVNLLDEKEQCMKTISCNATKYENELQEKNFKIDRLEKTNASLDGKLQEAKKKIEEFNNKIVKLDKGQGKLDQISELQKEILRLNKDKRKLEGELTNHRSQLANYENSNKKLEDDLKNVCGRNDSLQCEIKNFKRENDQLTSDLFFENSPKEQLTTLPNKIYNEISALKNQVNTTEMESSDFKNQLSHMEMKSAKDASTIDELQRQIKFQNNQACIQEEKIMLMESANLDLKADLDSRLEELKDLTVRIKKTEKDKLESKTKTSREKQTKKITLDLEFTKSKNDAASENVAEVICKINHLENENKQRCTEIQKLTCDVRGKNAEIKALKEDITSLTKERDDLIAKLKTTMVQYNSSLLAVKKKYDRSVKALHEKHNESVVRLQKQYEEVMKDNDNSFDSEIWIRSLSLNEMAELHNRICMMTSCVIMNDESNVRVTDIADQNNQQHQHDLSEKHQLSKRVATLENEIVQKQQDAHEKVHELEIVIAREQKRLQELGEAMIMEQQRNSELQNRLLSSQSQSHCQHHSRSQSRNRSQSQRTCCTSDAAEVERDLLRRQSAYNQDCAQNIGHLLDQQRKRVKELEVVLMTAGPPKDETFDWQLRKDFIHQCSMHHKYDNHLLDK